jgi:cysteine desulfurase
VINYNQLNFWEKKLGNRIVYMDNNATTPLHPEVKKKMHEAMEFYGNPSSLHSFGRRSRHYIDESRETIANFIGADADEIIFVGSGSEANNTVLGSVTCQSRTCDTPTIGSQIITTRIEHPCILETAKCLCDKDATTTAYLDVDSEGKIKMDQLKTLLNENCRLVSVMMANNEIGTFQDIKTIAAITHEAGALFHTDAIQAVGKVPINVKELEVDFLSLSAHKIYGPKGIGAIYVRKGINFCPLIIGGHQESGRRAGTENTLGIIGLAKAIEMRTLEMDEEANRLRGLKKMLREGIEKNIPDVRFIGHPTDSIPGTLNVSFEGAEGEALLLYLDLEGIAISTGSACASGSLDPSHVIMATGVDVEFAHGSLRISMGRDNTQEEVEYVIKELTNVVERVRSMSTAYNK